MDYESLQREKPSGGSEAAQGLNIERLTPFLEQPANAAACGQGCPRRGFGTWRLDKLEGVS